ncbi:unnamed protein product [Calicophoron daubneyi]|uniref:PRELI/MSF1 domain-containing protein n=1 Tax=Calicophoron daubneyi TaxID=300641 RepID=A0AAV2T549_CALDB
MPLSVWQTLGFSWDFVVSLYWDKYPNPQSKHVLTEDVIERRLLPGWKLYTKRLMVKRSFGSIPGWLRRLIGGARELIVEESIVDMGSRRFEVVTRNVGTFTRYATILEYCLYSPSTSVSTDTTIFRALHVDVGSNHTLRYPITYFLSRRYPSKAKSALVGFEWVCQLHKGKTLQTTEGFNHVKVADAIRNAAKTRTREAREFASSALPRVVQADTRRLNEN